MAEPRNPLLKCLERISEVHPNYRFGCYAPEQTLPDNIIVYRRKVQHCPRLFHNNRHVLLIALKSIISLMLDDRWFDLDPDRALLIFPHQLHRFPLGVQQRGAWVFVTFEYPGDFPWPEYRNSVLCLDRPARDVLRRLLERYGQMTADDPAACRELALETGLLLNALRPLEHPRAPQVQPRAGVAGRLLVERVGTYVRAHLSDPLRLERLAQQIGLSESYLRRQFRESAGVSLGHYLTELRMHAACSLLLHSQQRIKEIAAACGYGGTSVFTRAFTREIGLTPRAFRAQKAEQLPRAQPPQSAPAPMRVKPHRLRRSNPARIKAVRNPRT